MRNDTGPAPVVAVLAAIFVLSGMDAMIKGLGDDLPVFQLVLMRVGFGALAALPLFVLVTRRLPDIRSLKANATRAVVMFAAQASFFYAITTLPLVEAITLAFTAPLFLVLIARLVLGEPVRPRAIVAVGIGFAGVAIVVWGDRTAGDGARLVWSGVAAALLSSVTYALAMVLLRKHSAHDPIPALVFLQATFGALVALPFAAFVWVAPSPEMLASGAVIGLLGTAGHLMMAWGFSRAHAGRLAALEYSGLIWGLLFGIVFFAEWPRPMTHVGAAVIVIACLVASGERPGPVLRRGALAARPPGGTAKDAAAPLDKP